MDRQRHSGSHFPPPPLPPASDIFSISMGGQSGVSELWEKARSCVSDNAQFPASSHTHREPQGSSSPPPFGGRNLGQGTCGRAEGADVPEEAVGGTKNRAWGGAPDPAWGRPPHRSRAVNTDTACLCHSPGKCLHTEVMLLSGLG